MKKFILLISVIIFCIQLNAQNLNKDKEAIEKVIQTAYVDGLQNEGDITKIDSGIHPNFNLIGIGENDTMWSLPINKWKNMVKKKKTDGKW